jgi:predicted phosphoribosyltransferase
VRIVPWHEPFYPNRAAAGPELATAIWALVGPLELEPLVYGVARGGVVAAAAVAAQLNAPLGAVASAKVDHPLDFRYVVGAMTASGHGCVFPPSGVALDQLERKAASALGRAQRLERLLRAESTWLEPLGRDVIVVDDGMTSGATMLAAVRSCRGRGARRIFAATPAGSTRAVRLVETEADGVVCLHQLEQFGVVGMCYHDFSSVSEAEVVRLLEDSKARETVAE